MTNLQNVLITISLACWLVIVAFELFFHKRKLLSLGIHFIFIGISAYVLNRYFGYFNTIVYKGGAGISEGWILFWLYVFTILGILGHHVFIQIKSVKKAGKQPKLIWLPLIKPLIISPIIFLAVLNQLKQLGANSNALTPVITQFILAFQNGFFWKTVIERFQP